jgi:hypothetical protein
VLFDTGMHPDCQRDPVRRVGSRIASLFSFRYQPGQEISARLEAIDRDPARIDFIINSHLHFDHVGGNALIPNAVMVVQKREWEARLDPDIAARHGFNRADFDLGHKLNSVDGEHDLFGDSSLVCLPTHGHTPGHQSLRIRLASGDVVLAADACYFCRTLRERRLPQRVHDRARRCSLRSISSPGLRMRGLGFFSGMMVNSGKPYPKRQRPSPRTGRKSITEPGTTEFVSSEPVFGRKSDQAILTEAQPISGRIAAPNLSERSK